MLDPPEMNQLPQVGVRDYSRRRIHSAPTLLLWQSWEGLNQCWGR
jgi:hypothetical protein